MTPRDGNRAAQIFKRGAELIQAHCQHLHATALLYGTHGIHKVISTGPAFLRQSAEAKFKGSLQLLAEFYEMGEFELPVDSVKAADLRGAAERVDVIDY